MITLEQALDLAIEKQGFSKKWLSEQLGIRNTYYSTFVKRKQISLLQANKLNEVAGLDFNNIDIKIKGE